MSKKLKHKIANISLLITTLAETPLIIAYVFRINIPHMNIAAGIGSDDKQRIQNGNRSDNMG